MYYFVCVKCGAKFFHDKNREICPRCGAELTSSDEQLPPWVQHAMQCNASDGTGEEELMNEAASDNQGHAPDTDTELSVRSENRPTSLPDAEQQNVWETQYRLQLRRRLCPGCGEADDIPF